MVHALGMSRGNRGGGDGGRKPEHVVLDVDQRAPPSNKHTTVKFVAWVIFIVIIVMIGVREYKQYFFRDD